MYCTAFDLIVIILVIILVVLVTIPLLDLDGDLSNVLLLPHVFIRFPGLFQGEHFLVDHRVNVVGLDGFHHVLHLSLRADIHASHRADPGESFQQCRVALRVRVAQESDDADNALELDRLQALLQSARSTNIQHVVNALIVVRELARRLSPVGILLVVDNVVGAQLLEELEFVVRRGSSDDGGTGGFGELYIKVREKQKST